MPLINYRCECGAATRKFFRHVKEISPMAPCHLCGKDAKKELSAPNSKSIVVVDNGVQARATEVNLELVKDIEDRSTKDFKDK